VAYKGIVVALGMILASAQASAQANSTAPSPVAKPPKQAQPVQYCIVMEPFTGSRTSKTECKTREQWAREGVDVDKPQSD
jgi:hypothetical protein